MLNALHARLRTSSLLHRFTALTRILLAIGFIPPGLKKVMGVPFTLLPTTTTVGYFFDAFFQAHEFYVLVGVAQVAAGVLLLFPRTATLGAVLYLPIIVNISAITFAMEFRGTWVLTLLMALACLYLLCWDYDRLKGLLPVRKPQNTRFTGQTYWKEAVRWGVVGMVAYGGAATVGLANLWAMLGFFGFLVFAAMGAIFGVALAGHLRWMPAWPDEAAVSDGMAAHPPHSRTTSLATPP